MSRLRSLKALLIGAAVAIAGVVTLSGTQPASAAIEWTTARIIATPDSNFEPMREYFSNPSVRDGKWNQVSSLSCAARGECTVGAMFNVDSSGMFGSLVTQTNGAWGTNQPPANWFNPEVGWGVHNVTIKSVKCFASGDCSLVGMQGYTPTFASKSNGQWSAPQIFPGMTCVPRFEWPRGCSWGSTFTAPAGTPNMEPNVNDIAGGATLDAMDCSSAGNCVAAGMYTLMNTSFDPVHSGGFIAVQTNGVWSTPIEIPGLASLTDVTQGGPQINSISCVGSNYCVLVGAVPVFVSGETNYADPNLWCCRRAFSAVLSNGVLSNAALLPGLATTGESWPNNVKCFSAGNCITTGLKRVGGTATLFSSSLSNGTWSSATTIPGTDAMAPWHSWWDLQFRSMGTTNLSCPSAGNCTLAGHMLKTVGASEVHKAYVVEMTNGTWSTLSTIPGVESLGAGTSTSVSSIDCPAAGECVAIGSFRSSVNVGGRFDQPYVAVKTNGTWGTATQLSGLDYTREAIDFGSNWKVSCSGVGECAVAGNVANSTDGSRIFVSNYSDPTPPTTTTTAAPTTTQPATTLPTAPIAGVLPPGVGRARIGTRIVEPVKTISPAGKVELAVGDQTFVVPDTKIDLGRPVSITGSGAKPFTMVTVQLFSTPQVLGSFPVAADGTFSGEAIIPAGTPAGDHSLQMVSLSPTGEEVVVQMGVSVTNSLVLPATGSDRSSTLAAVLVLALGAMVLAVRRRTAIGR